MSEVLFHRLRYFLSPQLDVYRHIAAMALDRWGSAHPIDVLDVGTGTGVGLLQLAGHNRSLTGTDTDDGMLSVATDLFGAVATFEHHNIEHGPLPKADVVMCVEVLEHVIEPEAALRFLRDSVSDLGFLVVTVPNADSQVRKNDAHLHDGFTYDKLHELAMNVFGDSNWSIYDYTLDAPLEQGTSVTPLVLVWLNDEEDSK